MQLHYSAGFVGFGALSQGGEQAAEVHPRGVAEDDRAGGVVGVEEGAEERVEVVGTGGEVEPGWVQERLDVGVEWWHARDRGGVVDEGGAEGANWGGGHCCFYGVIDV